MELFEALFTRRSVRRYTDRPVGEESVTSLLRAAMAAPSAGDQRPWRFIVLRDRERLEAAAAAEPYGAMIAHAQLAVVICADLDLVEHDGFWQQDCAAATQNLLLAAHALGLGAVWVGTYPREDRVEGLRRILGLPDNLVPFSVVPIGYPATSAPREERFDAARVYFDKWEARQ
jgi:nitroreductase